MDRKSKPLLLPFKALQKINIKARNISIINVLDLISLKVLKNYGKIKGNT
jgi:hypothetical protein